MQARAHQDSRWYTRAGVYRDVWMITGDVIRNAPDGVRVTTMDVDDKRAMVEFTTRLRNNAIALRTLDLAVNILDSSGNAVAGNVTKVTLLPGEYNTVRSRLGSPVGRRQPPSVQLSPGPE
ncbi:hypothetical protein ACFXKY_15090 [Streptomyces canus]|uniref:hypothetical protein n=1 Tax=Streptomyces canus TaxID=58343 RepID=UPI0036A2A01B